MSTSKTRAHIRYKNQVGDIVPGVTTVLGILEKIGIHYWIAEVSKGGQDWTKVRDTAGGIGTLLHYFILCDLKNEKPDTSEYSAQDIDKAESCLIRWWDWKKEHKVEPLLVETPLVSEEYQFGGTPDILGKVDDVLTLMDFKTSKAVYAENLYQLAAYRQLLREQGHNIESARILRIGREETEGFEDRIVGSLDSAWGIFIRCLEIYQLQKELK